MSFFHSFPIVMMAGILCCSSCAGGDSKEDGTAAGDTTENNDIMTQTKDSIVIMETNLGTMKIKLYNQTPAHRDNFLKLAAEGFYDGLRFHRVINGFMIQGGDPLSRDIAQVNAWGTGGPGYTVPAEFVDSLRHKKGALAAARQGDMANPRRASSGSQFYIVQSEGGCRHLDGQYTVYGEVIEGLDVVDRIASVDTDPYDRPLQEVVITKVYKFEPEPVAAPAAPADSTDSAAPADTTRS